MNPIIQKFGVFIAVLCASLSVSAYDFKSDGLYYTILSEEDRTVEVVGTYYVSGDLEIPRKVIYNSKTYTVTRIGDNAIDYRSNLTSVKIPNTVISIGDYAFSNCSSLTSVTIPNSVTSIGKFAFYECRGLTSVTIGNSVTSIGEEAFILCSSLENFDVDPENNNYSSIDGILYNNETTCLICCPGAKISVTIPESVTTIGENAFNHCSSLTSVTIPNSVTSIENRAFSYCSSLTSVTIPDSVTSIGDWIFSYCYRLASVKIGNSVTSIGERAFLECGSLTSVSIPESVTSIGEEAFYDCDDLASITIPNSVTSIGNRAFGRCKGLASVTIGNSVTSIGEEAFILCSSLSSVTIPNSVTSIGNRAFSYCSNLTSVTIGNSVTSIGERAFYDCNGIKDIYMQCEVPIECSPGFSDYILKTTVLYVPTATLTEYEKVDPWRNFWNIEEMAFSGVNGIEADNNGSINVSVNNGTLTIDGIGSNESVIVYDMQGCMVFHGTSHIIKNLSSGLYIVVTGRRTVKVMI